MRVGGDHGRSPLDVRFVAATNRDLRARGRGGPLPPRPVLPARRRHARDPAAARARDAIGPLALQFLARAATSVAARRAAARRASCSRGSPRTTGRATCASSRRVLERAVLLARRRTGACTVSAHVADRGDGAAVDHRRHDCDPTRARTSASASSTRSTRAPATRRARRSCSASRARRSSPSSASTASSARANRGPSMSSLETTAPGDFDAAWDDARIGRYVYRRLVGSGGMGVVVAAHDPELDREVAIKLVGARTRVRRAIVRCARRRRWRSCRIPNVVTVYEVDAARRRALRRDGARRRRRRSARG